VCTTARPLSLPWAKLIQSTLSHPISLISTLILSSHLYPVLHSGHCFQDSPQNPCTHFSYPHIYYYYYYMSLTTSSSHSFCFEHPNNTWRQIQTLYLSLWKLIISMWGLGVESNWNVMAHDDAREGKWRGNWQIEWVSSTLRTTSEHGVSSITTADAHTSAASSRLNWRPSWFKWTRPFRRKTKSGFCACAITFQTQSTLFWRVERCSLKSCNWSTVTRPR
jgi:hypothetical protein